MPVLLLFYLLVSVLCSQLSDSFIPFMSSLCLSYWILIVIVFFLCVKHFLKLFRGGFHVPRDDVQWLGRSQHLDIGQSTKCSAFCDSFIFLRCREVTHFNNDGIFFINSIFPDTLRKTHWFDGLPQAAGRWNWTAGFIKTFTVLCLKKKEKENT